MPNQQKYRPISFRPPEAYRLWLIAYAKQTGQPINAILAEALREYRDVRTLPGAERAAAVVDRKAR